MTSTQLDVYEPVLARLLEEARARRVPLLVGVCGPQGSGKSTLAQRWTLELTARGVNAIALSLDDFYLTREQRVRLSREVHPLLVTRGVPGTHDVELTERVLDALGREGMVAVPVFDKLRDDRLPPEQWRQVRAPVQIVLFEGWCVGARPQTDAALASPVNELERTADPSAAWRRYVNDALAGPYRRLFARLERLILLNPPSFSVVYGWRREQEMGLRSSEPGASGQAMNDAELARFIQHYERLTRHILAEMPARADAVIELDGNRGVRQVRLRALRATHE